MQRLLWLVLLAIFRHFCTVRGWVTVTRVCSTIKNNPFSCDEQSKSRISNAILDNQCALSATAISNDDGDSRIDDDYREFQVIHSIDHEPSDVEFHNNKSNQNRTVSTQKDDKIDLKANQQNIENIVRKKIRVARAQAEIDRILTGPDAPCDLDHEWGKVTSIAAINVADIFTSVPNINTSIPQEEAITTIDDKLFSILSPSDENLNATNQIQRQQIQAEIACQELEQDMHRAIKVNDFDLAMRKKESLDRLQMDHGNAVLQLNSAFYKAFSAKDYKSMSTIWIPDSTATCILPTYKKPLVGNRAVLRNWQELFESKNANAAFQRSWIEPSNIHMSTIGSSSMVIVTCNENVYVRRFIRGKKRQTVHVNTLQATNIFRKVAGIWYLQYHHASPMSTVNSARNIDGLKGADPSLDKSERRSLVYDKNMFDESDDDGKAAKTSGIDAVLGIKNLNADIGLSDKQQPSSAQPKRIIMGGLSDLLNGNLGNLLSGASSENKGARGDENEKGFAIIRVSRENNDDEDDFEDEDDDDDDEDDEFGDVLENLQIHSDSALNVETRKNLNSITINKHWANAESNKKFNKNKDEQPQEVHQQSRDEMMRMKCISSLRKLTQQGLLSPSHKRVLLTDIITRAVAKNDDNYNEKVSSAQKSLVQVAYELLLGYELGPDNTGEIKYQDDEWKSIAEEEFAEQCRLFADELM
jgi:ketosteroid isomerase-like protein